MLSSSATVAHALPQPPSVRPTRCTLSPRPRCTICWSPGPSAATWPACRRNSTPLPHLRMRACLLSGGCPTDCDCRMYTLVPGGEQSVDTAVQKFKSAASLDAHNVWPLTYAGMLLGYVGRNSEAQARVSPVPPSTCPCLHTQAFAACARERAALCAIGRRFFLRHTAANPGTNSRFNCSHCCWKQMGSATTPPSLRLTRIGSRCTTTGFRHATASYPLCRAVLYRAVLYRAVLLCAVAAKPLHLVAATACSIPPLRGLRARCAFGREARRGGRDA